MSNQDAAFDTLLIESPKVLRIKAQKEIVS